MNTFRSDLRPLLFDGAPWYASLKAGHADTFGLWRVTKSPEEAYWAHLLSLAASFAQRHGLLEPYRIRIAGIPLQALTHSSAQREHRASTDQLWDVTNELIVAAYLERLLGWTYLQHEPQGRASHRGEWEFRTPSGRVVFVEVKSLHESEEVPRGVYSRGVQRDRIHAVLKGAYQQLPNDDRATLVVLVGRGELPRISHGILYGDIFQSLFGQMQVRFPVGVDVEEARVRVTPSFRDMFVQRAKHRRLGVIAGLALGGLELPLARFYAIHNPYAHENCRLPASDFADIHQFVVDAAGAAAQVNGLSLEDAWARIDAWEAPASATGTAVPNLVIGGPSQDVADRIEDRSGPPPEGK
ncbi:MAG: hypothetical protein MUF00_16970 [Gemmatimonadaceae bacterium]|jgi:hypothetical protein|nr:hypothetical protein [Gemmatimonadaceae bacterium]